MSSSACPDCGLPLQRLFVECGPGQRDVEVGRCARCAGLWVERQQLDRVVSRAVSTRPATQATSRTCPSCGARMAAVQLPAGVQAETCDACRGLWLDAGELRQLGGREPPPPPRLEGEVVLPPGTARPTPAIDDGPESPEADTAAARVSEGFECASCGRRRPFSDANGTAKGLVCGHCSPQVQGTSLGRVDTHYEQESFLEFMARDDDDAGGLDGVLSALRRLFR